MPSNKRIVAYLEDEDWGLWKKAVKKHKIGDSKLIKKIISNWLFQNKLQLENE